MNTDTPHSVLAPRFAQQATNLSPARSPYSEGMRALLSQANGSPAFRQECEELAQLPWTLETAEETLRFAQRAKQGPDEAHAAGIFALLAKLETFPEIAAQAKQELDSLLGQGAAGQRVEYLGGRFFRDLGDYRNILPMLGAGIAGELLGATVFSRLSASGYGLSSVRLGAAAAGFVAETSVFAGLQEGLRREQARSFSVEFASAALTLGLFKGVGFLQSGVLRAGTHWSPAGQWNRAVEQVLLPGFQQSSLLAGLWAVRSLETSFGLRPESSSSTDFVGLLAESLNLQAGDRLARALVPGTIPRFHQEAEWRRLLSLEKFQPAVGASLLLGLSGCSETSGNQGGHPAIGWSILALAGGLGLYNAYRSRRPVPPKIGEYFFVPSPADRGLLREFFWLGKVPEVISWTTWQKIQSRVLVQARLLPPRKYDKIPFTWRSFELQKMVVDLYSRKELFDLKMSSYVTEDPFPSPRD